MYDIDKIKMLSQAEGLNDRQIGEILGCSRVTITRIRNRNDIPTCEISNRKDKTYVCLDCGQEIFIKRKERRQAICPDCMKKKSTN
jgi:DNA-directed RNA polymerase subunit RPC12/RpoP